MKPGPLSRAVPPLVLALALVAAPQARAQEARADSAQDSLSYLKFRDVGPSIAGGRVAAVAGVPGQLNTYYVGAAGGGVWKTTDGGNSWKAVFAKEPDASIGAIAVAPSNPSIVWVGTGEGNIRNDIVDGHGVYVSTDAGMTWRFAGLPDAGQISRIVIDPSDPNRVFVAVIGNAWRPTPDRGVYRTTDGGLTWKKVLFVNDTTGASDLVMEPGNPRVLLAGMWQVRRYPWTLDDGGPGSGIWRSVDGGDTWTKLTTGLPKGPYGRIALGIGASNPTHVYALVEAKTGMLWDSHDLGDHWQAVSDNHAIDVRPFYFSRIDVAPNDDRHVFFSSFQLMESLDGGKTAHELDHDDVHPDHHALWIDPTNANRMIQGNDGGVWVSQDGGTTWDFKNNLPIEQFYMVAVDDKQPFDLCGGLQDNSAWCGPSNTLGFGGQNGAEWKAVTGGDGEYAVPAPSDANIIYTDSQNGFITRLDLKTGVATFVRPYLPGVEQEAPATLKYRFNWTTPIAVSPVNPNEVYMGGNVLFRSTDGGQHWAAISPDVTRNDKAHEQSSGGAINLDISGAETYNTILAITIAPSDTGVIWLGTDDGNVQVTRDGGKTWTNVRPKIKGLPDQGRVYQVGVSPFDPGTAYIAIDYHQLGNDTPYVFRTSNYGQTWTSISAGLPASYPAHVVREDPNQRGFLVLGTDDGLWYSRDDGAHWHTLHPAFPTAPVYDVQFVKASHDLVVATHGRGLFVLNGMTPLEEMTDAVRKEPVHLFTILPGTMWHRPEVDRPAASRYDAPNPPRGVVVNFWLAKKLEATPAEKARHEGPVEVLVTDAGGDTVFTGHTAGKEGVNQYVWRMTYSGATPLEIEPPRRGGGGGFGGGPMGPPVLPGTYTLTLRAAGKSLSQKVEVRADPNLPFDVAAASAQRDVGLELRNDESALNRMLNGLHSMQTQLKGIETALHLTAQPGSAPDTAVADAARTLDKKLGALMDTVYDTKVQRAAPEDDIHYLEHFQDELQSMGFMVFFQYDTAPNDLVKTQLAELEQQLHGYLDRYNALLGSDVASFNTLASAHGAGGLVVGKPIAVK